MRGCRWRRRGSCRRPPARRGGTHPGRRRGWPAGSPGVRENTSGQIVGHSPHWMQVLASTRACMQVSSLKWRYRRMPYGRSMPARRGIHPRGCLFWRGTGGKIGRFGLRRETFCAHRKSPAGGRTGRFSHQSPARTNTPADESPAARAYYARTASADTAILRRKLACMLS